MQPMTVMPPEASSAQVMCKSVYCEEVGDEDKELCELVSYLSDAWRVLIG